MAKRAVWVPTLRGWGVLTAVGLALALWIWVGLYDYLAAGQRPSAHTLVVPDWASDEVLEWVVGNVREGRYPLVVTVGGPLPSGKLALPQKTHAELTLAALRQLGATNAELRAISLTAKEKSELDGCALALRQWLGGRASVPGAVDIVVPACRARRTRLVFERVLAGQTAVGVVPCESRVFSRGNWWRCSAGVRELTAEAIALGCAWLRLEN